MQKINKLFKKMALVLALVIIVGAFGGGIVYAYNHVLLISWDPEYQTATYRFQNTFSSLTKTQFLDAMTEWNNQLTKSFLLHSGDTTATYPSQNGVNTVTKSDEGNDGVLAENHPYGKLLSNLIIESDIRFNTYYPWANSVKVGYYDIQGVMTHELGHVLRVGHSSERSDVMYEGTAMNEDNRVVTLDDEEAARDSTARWFR